MIRFEIDPAFVAEAKEQRRKIIVEVFEVKGRSYHRVIMGQPSPHASDPAVATRRSA